MKSRAQSAFIVLATAFAVTALVWLGALIGLRHWTGLPRISPSTYLNHPGAYNSAVRHQDLEHLREELAPIIGKGMSDEAKTLAVLQWVMNQIPRVENRVSSSGWEMVEAGRAGRGLLCGGMSIVFRDALLANDIPARLVFLQRNLFDMHDTHVTVEVFIDGMWRIYDPTFHITVKVNGERVGAMQAREWIYKNGGGVEFEFLGDVRYPARITEYPISYVALLNNMYVELWADLGPLGKVPGLGRWLSRELAYPAENYGLNTNGQDAYRAMYATVIFVLPVILHLLFGALILSWFLASRRELWPSHGSHLHP